MKRLMLAACAALAMAGAAHAQNYTAKDGSTPQQTLTFCSKLVGTVNHPCHVMEGTGPTGAPDPLVTDGSGHVMMTLFGPGYATAALQQSMIAALGTPLQAGGSVNVLSFPSSLGKTDASGNLYVTVTNPGTSSGGTPTGTAGSPNAAVVSIQGIAGGVAQSVSGTVAVSTLPNVTVGNFPATQPVSGTVAVSALPNTAATAALQQSEINALGTPLQAGGNVAVTALPASAATAANQATQITAEQAIATNTASNATAAGQTAQLTATQSPANIATGQPSATTTAGLLVAARTGRRSSTLR